MSAQHTPGPWEWDGKVWEYDAHEEAPFLVQAPSTDLKSKTILYGSIKCSLAANARLIAAAPELLAVLKAFKVASDQQDKNFDAYEWLEKVDQVIAKAEGK